MLVEPVVLSAASASLINVSQSLTAVESPGVVVGGGGVVVVVVSLVDVDVLVGGGCVTVAFRSASRSWHAAPCAFTL